MIKKRGFFLNDKYVDVSYFVSESSFDLAMGLRFKKNENMLLIFPYESKWKLDMMFCKDNLYLIFINSKGIIVDIIYAKRAYFNIFSWFKIYNGKAKYNRVLEINEKEYNKLKHKGFIFKKGNTIKLYTSI